MIAAMTVQPEAMFQIAPREFGIDSHTSYPKGDQNSPLWEPLDTSCPEVAPASYDEQKKHAASLNDAELCDFIERTFAPAKRAIAYNLPYLAEARERFTKQGRRLPVSGQPSWSEWISDNIGISDRHVRRLLAAYREQSETSSSAKPEKSKSPRNRKVLPTAIAKKGVKLAKLVIAGDSEAAKQLAATILAEAKNVQAVPVSASTSAITQCRGCEQLHSGIADALAASPEKSITDVARECGVSPVVIRQAATRYGLSCSLTSATRTEEFHVA
jgi:hypothetical protein